MRQFFNLNNYWGYSIDSSGQNSRTFRCERLSITCNGFSYLLTTTHLSFFSVLYSDIFLIHLSDSTNRNIKLSSPITSCHLIAYPAKVEPAVYLIFLRTYQQYKQTTSVYFQGSYLRKDQQVMNLLGAIPDPYNAYLMEDT